MNSPGVKVVLGTQFGDEGKGKLVDLLAGGMDLVGRCQGGNNAGHTVVVNDKKYAFHLLPSGIVHPNSIALIGNGVVVHLPAILKEIQDNDIQDWENRLRISSRAHLVFDFHQSVDGLQESRRSGKGLGTTKKGIGPTYSSKVSRCGIRMVDLVSDFPNFKERFRTLVSEFSRQYPELQVDVDSEIKRYSELAEKFRPVVVESVSFIHKYISQGKSVLVEGANASMLDIDFGMYPFVTSSNCVIGGVCTGLGIPPKMIGEIYGVVKAYTTRVGTGYFPTEQENEIGTFLQKNGAEYGTTTGRPRQCGWLDIPMLRYTNMLNGYTSLAITKLDVLTGLDSLKICTSYNGDENAPFPSSEKELRAVTPTYIDLPGWKEDISEIRSFSELPPAARAYVNEIESLVGVPVWWIGVGQARDAVISIKC